MSYVKSSRWRPEVLGNGAALLLLVMIAYFFLRITEGEWWLVAPNPQRWWLAALVVAGYAGFCFAIEYTARRRASSREEHEPSSHAVEDEAHGPSRDGILIAYASQTGFGEELARQTRDWLHKAGKPARISAIHQLDVDRLAQGGQMLFVASTTGQGDPPDHAVRFVSEVMQQPAVFESLQYGVLALGDRKYEQFCAFGRQLDHWLRRQKAQPLFDLIEVDGADNAALQRWQSQVAKLSQATNGRAAVAATPFELHSKPFLPWRLSERRQLNPGSIGGQAYYLALTPPADEAPRWVAGDIAEIMPRNAPQSVAVYLQTLGHPAETPVVTAGEETTLGEVLSRSQLPPLHELQGLSPQAIAEALHPHKARQYSIASLPEDGGLQLLVRRVVQADGQLGICSGWLCDGANPNETIELRIRSNPNFHPCDCSRPMILIGNGTGIAGLRSHLKARVQAQSQRNWLLFGERSAQHDFFFRDELERWQKEGLLERLDIAFSRDQADRIYVQHKVRSAAAELKRWVADGATIYVCGSLVGMAPAVDAALREILGSSQVDQMLADKRYRRDVY